MKNSFHPRVVPIWSVQVAANAALLAFAYWWLQWPDGHAWQVIASIVAAAVIVFIAAWLHTGTLSYLGSGGGVRKAFRRSLGRVPAFLIWAVVFSLALWALGWIGSRVSQASVRGGQVLGASPRHLNSAGDWTIAILQYVVVPAFFFVFVAQIAEHGFRAWSFSSLRQWKQARYWVTFAIALVVGAYLPYKLIWWIPVRNSGLAAEAWSAALRFGLAYLLAVSAWVMLASVLASGAPPASAESVTPDGNASELA